MVLPVRIELTTSALPRMRSTTELRQHSGVGRGSGLRDEARGIVKARGAGVGEHAMEKKDDKAERLAAALRENLRRRKAQARGTIEAPPAPKDES